jgi:hypothetical protein
VVEGTHHKQLLELEPFTRLSCVHINIGSHLWKYGNCGRTTDATTQNAIILTVNINSRHLGHSALALSLSNTPPPHPLILSSSPTSSIRYLRLDFGSLSTMKSWRSILCLVLLSLSAASARRTTSSVKAVVATSSSKAKVNRKVSSAKPKKVAFKSSSKNGGTTTATSNLMHRAKVGFYFGLWYALNIVYNSTSIRCVVTKPQASRFVPDFPFAHTSHNTHSRITHTQSSIRRSSMFGRHP